MLQNLSFAAVVIDRLKMNKISQTKNIGGISVKVLNVQGGSV